MRLNGWQRLWLVVSILLLALICWVTRLALPDLNTAVLSELEKSQCKQLRELEAGRTIVDSPALDDPCRNLTLLRMSVSEKISTTAEYRAYVEGQRWQRIKRNLLEWVEICVLIYILGWAVAWIRRGFRNDRAV